MHKAKRKTLFCNTGSVKELVALNVERILTLEALWLCELEYFQNEWYDKRTKMWFFCRFIHVVRRDENMFCFRIVPM